MRTIKNYKRKVKRVLYMFDQYNRASDTVKEGITIGDNPENWVPVYNMIGVTGARVYGFILGKNRAGHFVALVVEHEGVYKAVYIPKWYASHLENVTAEELNFMKSGAELIIEKREYGKNGNTYTYDVFLVDYKGGKIHI